MTTGSTVIGMNGSTPIYYERVWSGANDRRHKSNNAYHCVIKKNANVPCAYVNWLWPYDTVEIYCIQAATERYLPLDYNVQLRALQRAADLLRGHSFDASVFIVEGKEAVSQVVSMTQAIYSVYKGIRSLDAGQTLRSLARITGTIKPDKSRQIKKQLNAGDVSATWLSVQYGLQPLFDDIANLMEAIEARTSGPRKLRATSSASHRGLVDLLPSGATRYFTESGQGVNTFKYCVEISEQLSTPRSLGLICPASAIYEKIPFSFVLDWFIPVGNYLSEISFWTGLETSWSLTTSMLVEYSLTGKPPPAYYSIGSTRGKHLTIDRSGRVVGALSVPLPNAKSIEQSLSLGHLKNAAALIHQICRG